MSAYVASASGSASTAGGFATAAGSVHGGKAAQGGESWRRRLVRKLLYGNNVDRDAKARARLGLAILAFAVGYAVMAGRLVMFASVPDSQIARRNSAAEAVSTARPEILDRNGEILATDIRAPSLFAEPHRIIDVDEAVELLAEIVPDIDVAESSFGCRDSSN